MKLSKLLILAAVPLSATAQNPSAVPLTLEQALANALARHPALTGQQLQLSAAEKRMDYARLGMPLEAKLETGNVLGTGEFSGVTGAETTLSLLKAVELGGKAAARTDVAQLEIRAMGDKHESEKLDLLAQTAQYFVEVLFDQQRLQIALDKLAMQKHIHTIVTERVASGRSHAAELRKATIAIARAEIDHEHAEHELAVARLHLAASWGDTQTNFGVARGDLLQLDVPVLFDTIALALKNNPDLLQLASEERLAQARAVLAQRMATPNIELGVGVRYFNRTGDGALMLSASMPLDTRRRAMPSIDEHRLLAESEAYQYQSQYLQLYKTTFDLYQEMVHALTAFTILRERIMPEAELAAQAYEQAFRSGRLSLLELVDAQKSLLDARLELTTAAANYHRLRIELERLTGKVTHRGEKL